MIRNAEKLTTQVYDRHLDLPHSDIELHWPKITTTTRSWRDIGYTASCCTLKNKNQCIIGGDLEGNKVLFHTVPKKNILSETVF